MTLRLFEVQGSRSERVRWTLLELDIDVDSIEGPAVFKDEALAAVHPLRRVPALVDCGRPLFESAAICNWLADAHPEAGLLAPSGDWRRALHDQWVAFTLSELEASLWSTARNQFIYAEALRLPGIVEQNAREAKRALSVLDRRLSDTPFLIDGSFSLADIFVGYAIHWAHFQGLLDSFLHLRKYRRTLLEMPKCTFTPLGPDQGPE